MDLKTTLFVSKEGNDTWSGKLASPDKERTDGPLATLEKARDNARLVIEKGLKEPLTVMVREGKYFLNETLHLGPEDSGTKKFPVTYTAYPGEKVILSGGKLLLLNLLVA